MLFLIRQLNGGAPERPNGRPDRPNWSGFYQFWSHGGRDQARWAGLPPSGTLLHSVTAADLINRAGQSRRLAVQHAM